MRLSKFAKRFVTINSVAMLLSTATVPVLQPQLIKPWAVHAASTDDSGVSTWSDWGTVKWGIDSNGTLWIKPQSGTIGTLLDTSYADEPPWYSSRSSIKSVKLEGTIIAASNCSYLFAYLTNCTDMNLTNLDVSRVSNMIGMFDGCSSLADLDISKWDTSKVTDMSYMFDDCKTITNLDVSKWNTSNVTDMAGMFDGCSSLADLDISKWDTSKVTDMSYMFKDCSSLTNLNVSRWNTSKVTDMSAMFRDCYNLTELDVSNWDTGNVTTMYTTFLNCNALNDLDVSNWDTDKVTDMRYMFSNCSSLTDLDLSNWDTSVVLNMYAMFDNCNKLSELKLGKDFTIPSGQDTGLPDPSKTGEYTGRWSKADGSNGMSANDMLNLTGQEHDATGKSLNKTLTQEDRAGTWVWERGYTITLDPNGGSGSAKTFTAILRQDQVFGKDSASVYISDPSYTRKGYENDGTNEKKDGTGTKYQYPFTLKTSGDKTIYAQWKAHTGIITYNANGGTIGTSSKTGWSIAKDGTILLDGKAHHVLNGPDQAATENIAYGTQYDLVNANNPTWLNLVRTGYHVKSGKEWNTRADGTGTSFNQNSKYTAQQFIPSLENTDNAILTVYANWEPNTYTVKFDANGGAGTMADETMTYDVAKNLTASAYTRRGCTFNGWNTRVDGKGTSYADKASVKNLTGTNDGTVTLYAQWKKASWYDSGMSKTDTSDNNLHDPDSYIVTVPTAITFTGMNAGIVNQKVSYVTNVTGNIADNKSVKVTPDATTSLAGGSGNIKVTTKQAKSAWSFLDAYGNENSDGSRTGTDTTTTVDISGEAKSSDIYHGTIGFNVQLVDNIEYDYNYTGSIQTFTAPNTGTYLLEAWGAQSGGYVSDGSYYKNYTPGGYSVGSITLHKGDKLHIAVGGKGTDATYSSTDSVHGKGGWNGGGDGSDDAEDVSTESESLGGGGGATSIATSLINDGQLKNYKANQDKVLLVAGGAGSQDTKTDTTQDNTAGTRYGSGGGTNGNIGYVWPISDNYEKGAHVESSTQSAGYDFGQGENGDDNTMANHDGGGGGGGWYGGRTNTKYRWGGASGGSGYVSPLLTNGKMWQYLAETTNDITESTSSKSEKPNSMVAKFGNGYARISYLG